MKHGFIKVAAASPAIRVADPEYNARGVIDCIKDAATKGVKILTLPELCLTGATCGHLLYQKTLRDAADAALTGVIEATAGLDILVIAGVPVQAEGRIFSAAAVIYDGELKGFAARRNVEGTIFSAAGEALLVCRDTVIGGAQVFESAVIPGLKVGVQFSADRALPVSPAVGLCEQGATLICELASEPMSVYSADRTCAELVTDSRRLRCAFVSAGAGAGESTTDKYYSGLRVIVENGAVLASGEGGGGLTVSEIDVETLVNERLHRGGAVAEMNFGPAFGKEAEDTVLTRKYSRTPFLPEGDLSDFCRRALEIQIGGVIKRMEYTGYYKPVVGVSGGVDSTLVMLACSMALRRLGMPAENLIAVTMPCFGTTDRTKNNAITIAERLGATLRVIPIGDSVMAHFKTIGHDFENRNVVFENAQARERTMVLMDIANEVGGLDIGTKDLSEQADGWCTFNGDQISNYDINAGLTKTMVKAVVRYVADGLEDRVLADCLYDIDATPVTPELLPPSRNGELLQKSEDSVGPYILQDFFLYHMVMHGGTPEKVLRLAQYAFGDEYDRETLVKWLRSYCRRFFTQQFKRSCSADGPAVMGFTLSPRDGHKMPSDASNALWLAQVEKL